MESKLKKENQLTYDDIEYVEAHTFSGCDPFDRPNPNNEGDLQFSFQNALGAALLHDEVGLYHVSSEAISDPKLDAARSKIKLIKHKEWECGLNEAANKPPVRIIIKARNNQSFSKDQQFLIGSPEEPLEIEQIKMLYWKYTDGIIDEKLKEKTFEMLLNLELMLDLQELIDMLVFKNRYQSLTINY